MRCFSIIGTMTALILIPKNLFFLTLLYCGYGGSMCKEDRNASEFNYDTLNTLNATSIIKEK